MDPEYEIVEIADKKSIDTIIKTAKTELKTGADIKIIFKQDLLMPRHSTNRKNSVFAKSHIPIEHTNTNQNLQNQMSLTTTEFDESDDEQITLFQLKNDHFYSQITGTDQYKKIQAALFYYQDGQLQEAYSLISEAYFESKSIEDLPLYIFLSIQSLIYKAQIERCLGQFENAIKTLERCLKDFEVNDSDILAKVHLELGLCNAHVFRLIKAINHYKTALIIYEGLNWKLDIARCLNKLAFVHSLISPNYTNAKKLCYEALAIYRKKLNKNDLRICETYHTLGHICFMEKDYETSLEYLKKSLTGKKDIFGEKHICMVKTLNLLGMNSHMMEQYKQATDYYEEAVLIFGSEIHLSYAQVLNNLGLVYLEQRKVKNSTFAFQQALDISSEYYKEPNHLTQKLKLNLQLSQQLV